jgi:hypothetical protein
MPKRPLNSSKEVIEESKRNDEHETSEMRIRGLLQQANTIAEAPIPAAPLPANEEEKRNIRHFCEAILKTKEIQDIAKTACKPKKYICGQLKDILITNCKEAGNDIFRLPKNVDLNLEFTSRGFAPLPHYIRLGQITSDATITPDILAMSLESLTREEVFEAREEKNGILEDFGPALILKAFLNCLRRMIRSIHDTVKLTDTTPRGFKPDDIPYASAEMIRDAIALHENSVFVQKIEREKREQLHVHKETSKALEGHVKEYFQRAKLQCKKFNIDDVPILLRQKVSIAKPKLNLKNIEEFFSEALSMAGGFAEGEEPQTFDDVGAFLDQKRQLLSFYVQEKFDKSVKSSGTEKVIISLQKLKLKEI